MAWYTDKGLHSKMCLTGELNRVHIHYNQTDICHVFIKGILTSVGARTSQIVKDCAIMVTKDKKVIRLKKKEKSASSKFPHLPNY